MRVGTKITLVARNTVLRVVCRSDTPKWRDWRIKDSRRMRQGIWASSSKNRNTLDQNGAFPVYHPRNLRPGGGFCLTMYGHGIQWIYGWPALNSVQVQALIVARSLT